MHRLLLLLALAFTTSTTSAQTGQRPILLFTDAAGSADIYAFDSGRPVWTRAGSVQPGDLALLILGGIGGGLAAGLVAVALDPPVTARVAIYGLGVAAGTTLSGRLQDISGSPLGALVGAAVGSGVVLWVAQTTDGEEEGLSGAATVGLLGLVVPPVLSAGGYVVAPALLPGRSPGLVLRVEL